MWSVWWLSGLHHQKLWLYLHFPCFLFSSISILRSLRFSSLTFFCLWRLLFSSSSAANTFTVGQSRVLKSSAVKPLPGDG